jgi:hypothetical protein
MYCIMVTVLIVVVALIVFIGFGVNIVYWFGLIDYLQFYVPLKNILLIWKCHHCR